MLDNLLKDCNLFVDGRGYAGQIEEITPPKLATKDEELRAGGMDAPVDVAMGMEKLTCDFSLVSYEPEVLKLWGLAPGNESQVTIRGALESEQDGTVKAVVMNLTGRLRESDPGTWKPGERATLKGSMTLTYYKLTVDGETTHEIDVPGYKRIIDGVDQVAAKRAALGL